MRLWIDNTGLQSAGLCLHNQGRDDGDVEGLLQLGTFLAFSDGMLLSDFELSEVADKTSETIYHLRTLGVTDQILDLVPMNHDTYQTACLSATKSAEENLVLQFGLCNRRLASLRSVCVADAEVARTYDLALTEVSGSDYDRVSENAPEMKAAGAVRYMLATSPRLRIAIRNWANSSRKPEDADFEQIDSYLRFHINEALADMNSARYGPAIPRAALLRTQRSEILQQLTDELQVVASEITMKPLGVPPVAAVLAKRSKGDPRGLISEALSLREKTSSLRKWLGGIAQRYDPLTPEGAFEVHHRIGELIDLLRMDLGLKRAPGFQDPIELLFVVGFPIAKVSGARLLELIEFRIKRRKVAVLSELSKASAFMDGSLSVAALRKNCLRHYSDWR